MPRTHRRIDLAQILSIQRAIAGQLDYRAVIAAVSNEITDLLPHDHLDVALLNQDGSMVTAYETGLHTEWDAATTAIAPVEISPIRDLFRGKVDHIITDDAQTDPRFHFGGAFSRAIFAAGLRSRLHAPLKVERRVVGALSFSTQEIGTYKPFDVEQVQIVADIVAPYFFALHQSELVRLRERQQVEAEARAEGLRIGALHLTDELENARQALGMDLHDQTLADLTRISRTMRRHVARAALSGAELQPTLDDVEACIRELRVIIDNAKPSVLQFFGFSQAIEALLERSTSASTRPLSYSLHEEDAWQFDQLPPNMVVTLYRIAQEAINNTVLHANASTISVRLATSRRDVRLIIEDNGEGLGETSGRRSGGLANMATRASLIRAELRTTPGLGGVGTRLELTLPLQRVDETAV